MIRITAVCLLLAGFMLPACGRESNSHAELQLGSRAWSLEIAADEAAIQQGLMDRADLPDGTGMLFVFASPGIHEFWMANCLIDIDVIFIDGQGRIAAMHEMKAEPPRQADESVWRYHQRLPLYTSRIPVRFAIELPAGSIAELGLRAGQPVDLDLQRLKSLAQ
jgi:hypothetical protein